MLPGCVVCWSFFLFSSLCCDVRVSIHMCEWVEHFVHMHMRSWWESNNARCSFVRFIAYLRFLWRGARAINNQQSRELMKLLKTDASCFWSIAFFDILSSNACTTNKTIAKQLFQTKNTFHAHEELEWKCSQFFFWWEMAEKQIDKANGKRRKRYAPLYTYVKCNE